MKNAHHQKGLTSSEVVSRIAAGRVNSFKQPGGRTYKRIIQENVFTFINILLAIIALMLVWVGRTGDGVIYFSVALLNIMVGLIQEIRAKQKLDSIADLVSPKTRVIRDGKEILIDSIQVVEGDLIVAGAGDLISVDGLITEGESSIDEAMLTGESDLIEKGVGQEVFGGTSVVTGRICFVARGVGADSLANQISSKAKVYERYLTPIQKEINITIRILFLIAVTLGAMVSIASYLSRMPLDESLQIAAVILGIIPNSLFAMINLSYALGGVSILQKGALVQKLNAVESLSNVDVLCLDKTGTLTTKNLILENIIPVSELTVPNLKDLLADFALNVTDPNATVEAITKKISDNQKGDHTWQVLEEVPFSSVYKWSAIRFQNKCLILGAPEAILPEINMKEGELSKLQNLISKDLEQGYRVLLLADGSSSKPLAGDMGNHSPNLPEQLEILAVLVFSDQIRSEAKQTLRQFKEAGVSIKIISGDNPQTVLALAKQIEMGDNLHLVSGYDLRDYTETQWQEIVEKGDIFGRITPEQKEKILKTLMQNGHYTAMIGDGVNDVMSLRMANLGIAMESGSQVTRSVADILLLKDSFASLPEGLVEGQKIRNGLEDIFKIYLTRIVYLVLIIIAVRIVGLPFPFTVKQSSLIATFTAGIPAIGLALWSRPGQKKAQSLIDSVLHFVLPASTLLAVFATMLLSGLTLLSSDISQNISDPSIFPKTALEVARGLRDNSPEFRTALTTFLILAGISLLIFVAPPSTKVAYGSKKRLDFRPTILALAIGFSFGLMFMFPPLVKFWDLIYLESWQILWIVVCLTGWLVSLQLFWKYKLLDRFLGINLSNENPERS